jgi:hypothetical protein
MFDPVVFNEFVDHLRSVEGKEIDIVVRIVETAPSKNQRGYYFGVLLPIIAKSLGYPQSEIDEVDKSLRDELLGLDEDGHTHSLSAEATTSQGFSEYIESVLYHCAALGIVLPDPDQVVTKEELDHE